MRRLAALVVLVAATLALPAHARENTKRIGVGFEPSLSGGFGGLSLVFPASPQLDLQTLVGGTVSAVENNDAVLRLGVGLRGLVRPLSLGPSVDLVIVVGAGYTAGSLNFLGRSIVQHLVHLEAGLRPEWFLSDWISVHTQAGVLLSAYVGATGTAANVDRSLTFSTATDVIGQAGLTLWF